MICPFFRMHFKSENCLAKGFRGHNLIWDQTNLHDSIGSTCPRGPVPKGSITTTTVNQKNPKYSSLHLQPGLLTCIESHDFVSFSQLDHNSDYGLALWSSALHATSAADLWMQGSLLASMQTCTPPPMPGTECHNHKNLIFSKYSSSHLQPGALTCIESHDCVSFSQLDRNSATGLALSLHATSDADLWMQGSLLASMQTCTPPPMPFTEFHNHNNLIFFKYSSSHLQPGALTCIESHD